MNVQEFKGSKRVDSHDEILVRLLDLVASHDAVRDERDRLKKLLEESTKECDKLRTHVSTMAYSIRDGIERAYSSWDEWQTVARYTLKYCEPQTFKELDSYATVLSFKRKKEAK